jgi:hypothetical protein
MSCFPLLATHDLTLRELTYPITPGGPDKGDAASDGDGASGTGGATRGLGLLGGRPCVRPGVG